MKKLTDEQMQEMLENIQEEIVADWGGGCSTHRDFVALAADVSSRIFCEAFKRLQED